uniref:Uncharacterized protein n=1 Tax=Anguilla anguilla TaxID=7936 RepID=A0A0E9TN73_ANGAN
MLKPACALPLNGCVRQMLV